MARRTTKPAVQTTVGKAMLDAAVAKAQGPQTGVTKTVVHSLATLQTEYKNWESQRGKLAEMIRQNAATKEGRDIVVEFANYVREANGGSGGTYEIVQKMFVRQLEMLPKTDPAREQSLQWDLAQKKVVLKKKAPRPNAKVKNAEKRKAAGNSATVTKSPQAAPKAQDLDLDLDMGEESLDDAVIQCATFIREHAAEFTKQHFTKLRDAYQVAVRTYQKRIEDGANEQTAQRGKVTKRNGQTARA